jgi:hypothetical protein
MKRKVAAATALLLLGAFSGSQFLSSAGHVTAQSPGLRGVPPNDRTPRKRRRQPAYSSGTIFE